MYESIALNKYPRLPSQFKVGDLLDGNEIIEIRGLVDGKCTYASTFICRVIEEKDA